MMLCENCLETCEEHRKFPIGHEFGGQRDPERHELVLCPPCIKALYEHRLDVFNERYSATRQVSRPGPAS